ncbi:GNAT family N-acetyltransferase [Mobilitalea sibirica]|uniref:GNAT family N-acetyltransferase n=1 Tax=Mobilitalea sibirica TaxID=1462919 RepID=A0A8J7H154_9FIRM|nr:GNAT family N-acetyltransferase [Mobilitalea sibirica]
MIEGNKVIIRQLELGDEDFLHKWRNDAKGNLYCGFQYGFLLSKEAFRLELKDQIENRQVFTKDKLFIICKKEDLTPIGDISYRNWDHRNRSAEFGIEIGEVDERSKGYGFDALYHFIDYMFNSLNLHRIELTTFADNLKAQKLYDRLGFKTIGIMREASFDSRTASYMNILYMDLLRREWDEIKANMVNN